MYWSNQQNDASWHQIKPKFDTHWTEKNWTRTFDKLDDKLLRRLRESRLLPRQIRRDAAGGGSSGSGADGGGIEEVVRVEIFDHGGRFVGDFDVGVEVEAVFGGGFDGLGLGLLHWWITVVSSAAGGGAGWAFVVVGGGVWVRHRKVKISNSSSRAEDGEIKQNKKAYDACACVKCGCFM